MEHRNRPIPTHPTDAPRFGRRASDRGFVSPAPWFGRRAGDKKAPVRHSLPFATQIAAQITPETPPAAPQASSTQKSSAQAYAGEWVVRPGLVKDLKA